MAKGKKPNLFDIAKEKGILESLQRQRQEEGADIGSIDRMIAQTQTKITGMQNFMENQRKQTMRQMEIDAKRSATLAAEQTQMWISLGNTITSGLKTFVDFSKQAVSTAATYERIKQSITFATGDVTAFQRITELSEKYGMNLRSMGSGFAAFAASTKNTKLAGKETEKIFTSITKAARAMNLTGEDTEGTLRALAQMMSKGKVGSEELRHQLGDRLPGSVKIAADALGVTTDKLEEMMKAGKVVTMDFLPKFAAQWDKLIGDTDTSQSLAAKIDRLTNSWDKFMSAIGNSKMYKSALDNLTTTFNALGRGISGDYSDVNMGIAQTLRQNIKNIDALKSNLQAYNVKTFGVNRTRYSAHYAVPEDLQAEAIRIGVGTYNASGQLVVQKSDIDRFKSNYMRDLGIAKMEEASQMIFEGSELYKIFTEKIQKGDYTQQEFQDFQARLASFHQKRGAILPELGQAFTPEAFKKTFYGQQLRARGVGTEFEDFLYDKASEGELFGEADETSKNIYTQAYEERYKAAMKLVQALPPPKPIDLKTTTDLGPTPPGGDLEDRIVASQPKVISINILTGEGASLIKNMDIDEIIDKETSMVSPIFRQKVTNVLYELLSDTSQLITKAANPFNK